MAKLYNLGRMTTATTGTGTITLGVAVAGYLTFANAGVQNGDVLFYGINDGSNSEVGFGTYTSSGTTLTRNVIKSTNSNAAINETLTRLPVGAPLASSPQDPLVLKSLGVLAVLVLALCVAQAVNVRKSERS